MIKLLIADDQLLFRTMLEEMLKSDEIIDVVASCKDGREALELAKKHKVDVMLLDIGMPYIGGIDVLKEIKEIMPDIKVIMLTTFENEESIFASVNYGADGYLVKDIKPEALIMAIKCAYNDIVLFNKASYDTIISNAMLAKKSIDKKVEIGDMIFDSIEISIIKYIALGKSNKDIAALLNYSEGTIKNKVSKILSMTSLNDRTQISVFAVKNRIV